VGSAYFCGSMRALFLLFARNGAFVLFVLLEALCFWLIVEFNEKQNSIWAHSMSLLSSDLSNRRQEAADYFSLSRQRDSLAAENARLQQQLANERYVRLQKAYSDTLRNGTLRDSSVLLPDSVRLKRGRPQFQYLPARVISNHIGGVNNFITLNKGSNDGLVPNMAVVTREGIVGIVRHVTPRYAYAMSILHRQVKISAKVKRFNAFGSLTWERSNPGIMTLSYIPKHFAIQPGDTIVTSGFSQMFPQGVMVGTVAELPIPDSENPYFTKIQVRLSQDMTIADAVYVVKNLHEAELETLRNLSKDDR
jgi:rod shape-determining protein MreC